MSLKDYLFLIRIQNSILMGLAVIVGSVISLGPAVFSLYEKNLVFGFLTGFFLTSSSMVLNDIFDIEIDKINAPQRPLPSGRIRIKTAWILFSILSTIGLLSSIVISFLSFGIATISWILSTLYNSKLKKTGLLGNIIVSYNVMIPILYGSIVVEMLTQKIVIFSVLIFLTCLGREIIKGIADIEGDKRMNIKTVAVTKGPKKAAKIAVILIVIAIVLSPIPYLLRLSNEFYLVFVIITDILFIYSSILILSNQEKAIAIKTKRIMLVAMTFGLLAFLFSTL